MGFRRRAQRTTEYSQRTTPHPPIRYPTPMPLRTLGVIPARLASTRLPRKLLRVVAGKPLLAWTVEAARACPQLDRILVAADSPEIAALCRTLNVPCELTSPSLPSGTDRIHAIAQLPQWSDAHIYVNLQGDEPLLRPSHIAALISPFNDPIDPPAITTLKTPCTPENIANPNAVKVVTTATGRALYFSRATIPYNRNQDSNCHPERSEGPASLGAPGLDSETRDSSPQPTTGNLQPATYFKHIGLYAYHRSALNLFPTLPPSLLEQTERLEQLRFLENNIPIHIEPTEHDTIGVDTEEDLHRVEALLLR
jgi:3-deoxy-manno-octulosonate cytidylyltransferase (CMP-KDO synthetase)